MPNQKSPCHRPANTSDSQSSKNSQLVSNNNELLNKTEELAKNDSQVQAISSKSNYNNESLEEGKSSKGQDCTEMFEDKKCLKTIKEKFAEFYALEYQKHLKRETSKQDIMAHIKEDKDCNYSQQEKLQNDKEQSDKPEKLKCNDQVIIKKSINRSMDQKYLKQEIRQYNEREKVEKEIQSKDSNYCDKNQQSDELETIICSCLEKIKSDQKLLEQDKSKNDEIPCQSKSLCSQTKIDHNIQQSDKHTVLKCDVQEKYDYEQDSLQEKENESNINTQNTTQPCKQQSYKCEPQICDDIQKTGSILNTAKSNKPKPCKPQSEICEALKCYDKEKTGSKLNTTKSNESQPCKQQPEKREPLKCDDKGKIGSNHNTAKSSESQTCKQQCEKREPLKFDDKDKIGSNQIAVKTNDNCIKECMRKISSKISKTYKGVEGCLTSTKSPGSNSKSAASFTAKSKSSKSSTSTRSSNSYKSAESSDSDDNLAKKKYLPPNNKNIIVSRAQQKFYEFEAKPIKKCKSKDTGKCIIN